MKDPLRKNVAKWVNYARKEGKLTVRMVSGDHIETAKQIAIQAGILLPDEARKNYAVMDAEEFRNKIGSI